MFWEVPQRHTSGEFPDSGSQSKLLQYKSYIFDGHFQLAKPRIYRAISLRECLDEFLFCGIYHDLHYCFRRNMSRPIDLIG